MEIVREYRDIPRWVVDSYVGHLEGATATSEGFEGPGWKLRIEELSPLEVGALRFTRVRLTLSGDDDPVRAVWSRLEPQFYRGGA